MSPAGPLEPLRPRSTSRPWPFGSRGSWQSRAAGRLRSSFGWSLSNLAAMLRMNLLTYRDLWKWLDEPYEYPALEPLEYSMPLFANILDSKTGGT